MELDSKLKAIEFLLEDSAYLTSDVISGLYFANDFANLFADTLPCLSKNLLILFISHFNSILNNCMSHSIYIDLLKYISDSELIDALINMEEEDKELCSDNYLDLMEKLQHLIPN